MQEIPKNLLFFVLVVRPVLPPVRLPYSRFSARFVPHVTFAIDSFRFLVQVDLSPAPGGAGWWSKVYLCPLCYRSVACPVLTPWWARVSGRVVKTGWLVTRRAASP